MMPKTILLSAAVTALAFAGCRQRDLREVTIDLPGLAPLAGNAAELAKAEAQIKNAFATYEKHYDPSTGRLVQANAMTGVSPDDFKLAVRKGDDGQDAVALTVRFDSLLVAEMNLVSVLDTVVVSNVTTAIGALPLHLKTGVRFPDLKKGAPAGYINSRKPEVRD